ncbi:hypothetical protein U1Q18_040934 [Sarracenia purpurea var. burkii]
MGSSLSFVEKVVHPYLPVMLFLPSPFILVSHRSFSTVGDFTTASRSRPSELSPLLVCGDGHTVVKLLLMIEEKKITVRDSSISPF